MAIIPTLQGYHIEESVKLAVAPHTWEDGMNSLLSSSMGQIAHLVWDGQFQTIKGNRFSCLIAWSFLESGLTIKKAKVTVPVEYMAHSCTALATFNNGQICVTNIHPVACVTPPPPP